MKALTLLIILATLIWTAWNAASFVWSLYLERQDPTVDAHIAWSVVGWSLAPTLAVILALVLSVRLAVKDLRR